MTLDFATAKTLALKWHGAGHRTPANMCERTLHTIRHLQMATSVALANICRNSLAITQSAFWADDGVASVLVLLTIYTSSDSAKMGKWTRPSEANIWLT